MNKLLTIVVPTYNTEAFLPKCLDSLIVDESMDLLEVLIVIDGSPDNSINIAKEYSNRYPNTFFTIDKENGGHGSTINKGIELATGKYFKVLDSDDWFDKDSFRSFLNFLKDTDVDVVFTDYVRELVFERKQVLQELNIEPNKIFLSIKDIDPNVFAMARITYKTKLLIDINLILPEKMFYVDTIYARLPMFYAKNFIYNKVPLYRYYIGRDGQSVSVTSSIKNKEDYKYIFNYLYTKEKEINRGSLIDMTLYKLLNKYIFALLSRLEYAKSKLEIREWDQNIKEFVSEKEIINHRIYKLYKILPFRMYYYLFNLYAWIRL